MSLKDNIIKLYEQYGAIEIKCTGADMLPLDKIIDFQGDLKKRTDKDLLKLIKNMFMNNFIAPFFTWGDDSDSVKKLIDGHSRLLSLNAIQAAGVPIPDKFPVDYIHARDEAEARKFLLSITSQFGSFIQETLDSWTSELDAEIAKTLRIVDTEVELAIAAMTGDGDTLNNDTVPDEVPVITELGDLWELSSGGNIHRIMCGDSTKQEDVAKLMDGQKADMVFCDPPYGMKLDTDWSGAKSSLKFAKEKKALGGKKYDKVIGDHEDFTPELITTVFDNFGYCKEIFLWGADYYAELLPKKNDGSWIVWDKRLDESADKMYGSTFELCWSKKKHKRMIARIKWAGIFGTEKEFDHKRHHPTQKPTMLVDWFFEYYSLADKNKVVDLYGGSGSTLISSEKNGKQCFMMELSEYYTSVIIHRYSDWCGANDRPCTIKRNGTVVDLSLLNQGTNRETVL